MGDNLSKDMDIIFSQDDITLPFSDETSVSEESVINIVENIMEDTPWLWRKSSKESVSFIEETDPIINSNAYKLREKEETVSLFELIEKYKAIKEPLLATEAEAFVLFIISEVREEKKEIIPICLIKELLIKNIMEDNKYLLFLNGIKKTPITQNDFFLAHHWDIFPPSNLDEDLNNMYNILSKSSKAFITRVGTDVCTLKMFSKNLSLKRKSE